MNINFKTIATLTSFGFLLAACDAPGVDGTSDGPDSSSSAITADGQMDFAGAATAALEELGVPVDENAPEAPATPDLPDSPVWFELDIGGDVAPPEPDSACLTESATAAFNAIYSGEGRVDQGGFYLATMDEAAFDVAAASPECEFEQPDIENLREATLRAEIQATAPVCEAYCESAAASIAEAECASDVLETACIATTEALVNTSCNLNCADQAWVIVAEAELSAEAMAELTHQLQDDGSGASAQANGSGNAHLNMNLSFSRMETEDGEPVPEATQPTEEPTEEPPAE